MRPLLALILLAASAAPSPPTTLEAGRIHLLHDDKTEGVALYLAERADDHAQRLEERLGIESTGPIIQVALASDEEAFDRVGLSETPDWAAGVAWPRQNYIVLRTHSGTTDPAAQERRLVHELAHVLVQRAAGKAPVPAWLTEGVAQSESGQGLFERSRALVPATIRGELMSLQELGQSFPADRATARLAYAQSLAMVNWLDREFGRDAIPTILRSLRGGKSLDGALVAATGRNLLSLENAYEDRVTWVHIWVPLIGSSGSLWVATTLLFGAAFLRKRRERKEGMKRLEALDERWPEGNPEEEETSQALWKGSSFRAPDGSLRAPDGSPSEE